MTRISRQSYRFLLFPFIGLLLAGSGWLLRAGERFGAPVLVPQIGHTGKIWSIDGMKDRSSLVTAGEDGTVKFWTSDGRLIRSFDVARVNFHYVAFSPDDKEILAYTQDGDLYRWQIDGSFVSRTKKEFDFVQIHNHMDGRMIRVVEPGGVVTLRNLDGGVIQSHRFEEMSVTSGAFSPDRQWILAGSEKGRVKLYGPRPPEEEKKPPEEQLPPFIEYELESSGEPILDTAFSPGGDMMIAGDKEGNVLFWNSGRKLLKKNRGHKMGTTVVRFSSDGKVVASGGGDGTVKLWSTTGVMIRDIPAGDSEVTDIRFSDDDRLFYVSHASGFAGVWNAGGKQSAELKSNDLEFKDFASPGIEGEFYTSGSDGQIRVHGSDGRIRAIQLVEEGVPLNSISLSPSGKVLAVVGGNGKVYFQQVDGTKLGVYQDDRDPDDVDVGALSVVMMNDTTAAVGGRDGQIHIIEPNGKNFDEVRTINGHGGPVSILKYSVPAGLLYSATPSGEFFLQTVNGEIKLKENRSSGPVNAAFAPNGKSILLMPPEAKAEWTSLKSGESQDKYFEVHALTGAISLDGENIAFGDGDGVTRIWNRAGKLIRTFEGHTGGVRYVEFIDKYSYLLAGDRAGIHQLFLQSRRQLSIVPTESGNLVYDGDHRFDLTGQKPASLVAFRRGWGVKLLELDQFFERFFFPGLYRKTRESGLSGPGLSEILERSPPPIVSLKLNYTKGSRSGTAMVRACDAGGGAGSPILYWNQSLYSLDKTNSQITDRVAGCLEKRFTVSLKAGENIFQGAAYSSEGMKGFSQKTELLNGEGDQTGQIHLVLIGIDRYLKIPLRTRLAEESVMTLWEKFDPAIRRRLKGEENVAAPPANLSVYSALGQKAGRSGILQAFHRAAERVKPGDTVIVYMAGAAGVVDGRFHFFQQDNRYDTMASLQNGINQDELITMISNMDTPYKILLIDGILPQRSPVKLDPATDFRVARIIARLSGVHGASLFLPDTVEPKDLDHPPETSVLVRAFMEALDGAGSEEKFPEIPTRIAIPYLENRIPDLRNQTYQDVENLPGDVATRGASFNILSKNR